MQDVLSVVQKKYLDLLREAIIDLDYEAVEDFWQKSHGMGSRGAQVRETIEKLCGFLGVAILEENSTFYLAFFGRERNFADDPFTYAEVRMLWHAGNIAKYLKQGQYSNAYSYAVSEQQELSYVKIPAIILGVLMKEKSIGTYLYYYAKCCFAVDPERAARIDTILRIHQNYPGSDGKAKKSLLRNVAENHDADVEELLKKHSLM